MSGVSASDIERMHEIGTPENVHLDYKMTLAAEVSGQKRAEFLKDVIAMANSEGGRIIYGVREVGGVPTDLPGISLEDPDDVSNRLDHFLRDLVDPPIPGVRHEPVPREDGFFYYVVDVPRSPLAPHMSAKGYRFYARFNTTNNPLDAVQIREIAVRHAIAEERARDFVSRRLGLGGGVQGPRITVHLVPLYADPYALDIGASGMAKALQEGTGGEAPVYSADGLMAPLSSEPVTEYFLFGREGSVEYRHIFPGDRRDIPETRLLELIRRPLERVREIDVPGIVSPPMLLSVQLGQVGETRLVTSDDGRPVCDRPTIHPHPLVVNAWPETDGALRKMLDHLWQGYGQWSCRIQHRM